MVMELCEMGELGAWISTHPNKRVSEACARQLMRQLAAGLYYLCGINVVHRDLKLANILCCRSDNQVPNIKIADFGLSRESDAETMMQTFVGTPLYMVCEMLLCNC
jgi:serine/threonine protein kinase